MGESSTRAISMGVTATSAGGRIAATVAAVDLTLPPIMNIMTDDDTFLWTNTCAT